MARGPAAPRLLAAEGGNARLVAESLDRRALRAVVLVARGSSAAAGAYGKHLLERALRVPVAFAWPSVVTHGGAVPFGPEVACVAVTQGGGSPDIEAVVQAARGAGSLTLAVTNSPDSPVGRAAHHVLPCHAGAEHALPATKSYVATTATLALLAASLPWSGLDPRSLWDVPAEIDAVLATADAWVGDHAADLAGLGRASAFLATSRGPDIATARELAVKLEETTHRLALGLSSAELMHGHVVAAGRDVPLVAVRPMGDAGRSVDVAVAAAAAAGSPVLVLGAVDDVCRDRLPLPRPDDPLLTPITWPVAGHALTHALAVGLGIDPDVAPAHVPDFRKVVQTL